MNATMPMVTMTKTFDIKKEYAVSKQVLDDSLDYVEAKDGVIDLYVGSAHQLEEGKRRGTKKAHAEGGAE